MANQDTWRYSEEKRNTGNYHDCSSALSYLYKQQGIDIGSNTSEFLQKGNSIGTKDVTKAPVGAIIIQKGPGTSGRHAKMIHHIGSDGTIYVAEMSSRSSKNGNFVIRPISQSLQSDIIDIRTYS